MHEARRFERRGAAMTEFDDDDLGEPGGKNHFDQANEIRQQILNWNVLSVGNRPRDHLQRDLIIASCHRDSRLWPFHKLRKNSPAWLRMGLDGFDMVAENTIVTLRCFLFNYLLRLARLREHARANVGRLIHRLWRCWPVGAEFTWKGQARNACRDVCHLPQWCPFCLARRVAELHKRILAGPLRDPHRKFLLLASITVSDENFLLENSDEFSTAAVRFDYIRKRGLDYLRGAIEDLGGEGGIRVVQMQPQLFDLPYWENCEQKYHSQQGFSYKLSLIAETGAYSAGRLIDLGDDLSGIGTFQVGEQQISPTFVVHDATQKSALRRLLVGTSPGFRGNFHQGGDTGAFTVPRWLLADPPQWEMALELLHGSRMYDTWGTWRRALPRLQLASLPVSPERIKNGRRAAKLRATNEERKKETMDRREDLAQEYSAFLIGTASGLNLSPGRQWIRDRLEESGVFISDRDARWLAKRLAVTWLAVTEDSLALSQDG